MGNTYNVIGLMSGTSLDGLDIAYCKYDFEDGHWSFEIANQDSIGYSADLKKNLRNATNLSGEELLKLDIALGRLFAAHVNHFTAALDIQVDFIACHGHTIFHQPESLLTYQAGNGQLISNLTGLQVIHDFRTEDVLLGGQGAPLVPIGDKLLFPEYTSCINLGGIANISYDKDDRRIAFDICPLNTPLNYLTNQMSREYDDKGKIASSGSIIESLLIKLNDLAYYRTPYPKSLGYEWVSDNVINLIDLDTSSIQDKLRTLVEHMAIQISKVVNDEELHGMVLITGGGALNDFLIERLKSNVRPEVKIIIPAQSIIEYKEALVFGFLGVLKERDEVNILASVTGAPYNHCAGRISRPQ